MDLLKRLLLVAVVVLTTSPAYATVYQYFDEEGTLIVTDNPYGSRKPKSQQPVQTNEDIKLPYRNDVSYEFYPVYGKNMEELVSSTNINGPFDSGEGKKFAGQTKWKTGWSYKFSSSYTGD
jgi:hypothetical protein